MILDKNAENTVTCEQKVIENGLKKCPFLRGDDNCMEITNFTTGKVTKDTLYHRSEPIKCQTTLCKGALMAGQSICPVVHRCPTELLEMARSFLEQYYAANKEFSPDDFTTRLKEVEEAVENTGSYELTTSELLFGAKLAWRNASRCIGRIQWNKLEVQDKTHITSTKEMYEALCNHLKYATNDGNIRSIITVFPPRTPGREDFRLWNPQLLNFAGYLQEDGTVMGDPGRLVFTRICQRLGWKGKGGRFDILPWVVSAPGEGVKWYEIPDELILRVKLEHPKYPWFADMDIKWYAVPAVADMLFDCGGIAFPAAPFSGWYMGTEIGARNLCDPQRYNLTAQLAEKMGLDTSTPISLWKDTVLLEVNIAVLYSFQKQQVTIVDHHTAAETFMKHFATEQRLRGGCPADWVWICPPISGSITPVYHQEMVCYNLKPSYEYQVKAWRTYKWPKKSNIELKYTLASISKAILWCIYLMSKVNTKRVQATILYATETGKSETLARKLEQLLYASFSVKVTCMDEYEAPDLVNETLLVVVASTFGSGEPPDNGKVFWRSLKKMKEKKVLLKNLKYSVFALGSSSYPTFCYFGKNIDKVLSDMGGQRLMEVSLGDELKGQEHTFNAWLPEIYQAACKGCQIEALSGDALPTIEAINRWNPETFRLVPTKDTEPDVLQELAKLHNKKMFPLNMLSRARLQACHSENQTILVRLDTKNPEVLNYEPGDHLGIFPTNPKTIVNAVLKRLEENGYSSFEVVNVETLKNDTWKPNKRLPPSTLRTYISRYLDITSPPSPHLLQMMARLATDHWDKHRLKRLATLMDEYEEWQSFRYPHLAEILEEFPSVKMDASLLLSELPLLQPRYYSISSSPTLYQGQVHLTITLVTFKTQDNKGPVHKGVCTSYLDTFPDGEISCFLRSAPDFHLPKDTSLPVIMIGAGSGIAPYRSFWQHRELMVKDAKSKGNFNSATYGPMVLFFGCREARVDNIYEQETSPLVRKGILTKVFTALSREPGKPKCHVQNELQNQSQLVKELVTKGGHVYVCGDSVIANGVRLALDAILQETVGFDVEHLLENDRYHEDVFGIIHREKTPVS